MNKKLIIYISCGILIAIIIVVVALYFVLRRTDNGSINIDSIYYTDKINIEKYEKGGEIKTLEIVKNKKIEELIKICDNISLEQDETTKTLTFRKDLKIDFNNGINLFIQLNLKDYCYIENINSNIEAIIKMPEGLFDFVQKILKDNKW